MNTHSSSRSKRQCSPLDRRIRKRQRTEQEEEEEASGSEAPPVERKHRSSDRGKKRESGSAVSSEGPPIKRKRRRSGRGKKKKSRTERDWYDRKWVCSPRDCSAYKGVENASNHQDLYSQVPSKYLNWDRRKKLIREELKLYRPSILCFQEVDRFDDLANLFEEDGYKGVYKGRTGEACDGCAIFWQEKQYTVLHQEDIEFQKFGLRNNVAQLCVLKMDINHSSNSKNKGTNPPMAQAEASRTLVVGNIHVLFNPNRGDIKLGQIRVFLEKAHALSQEWGNIPVVLAGDLNSMPQSAIYQFLASSELDILMHNRRNISGQTVYPSRMKHFAVHNTAIVSSSMSTSYMWSEEELRLAAGTSRCTHLQHHLKICSAYLGVPGNSYTRDGCGEPLATSYHSKFMGTVDYIWHSEELFPVRVVETLPVSVLKKLQGLPSENWGSDHLALVCELAFADDCNKTSS